MRVIVKLSYASLTLHLNLGGCPFPPRRFKKIVHGYIDEFESRGQSTYLLHRTLNHKNPEMFPAGKICL